MHRRIFIKTLLILSCSLGLLLSGCKKKEVEPIAGPKGEQGAPGIGGNADVTSITIFQVNASKWEADTATNGMKATFDFPEITRDVVDHGAVKVFIKTGNAWSELPFVRGDLFTQFGFDEGYLYLHYINIEGILTPAPQVDFYRLVIYSKVQ